MGGWRPCGAGLLLGLRLYRGLGAIHFSAEETAVQVKERHLLDVVENLSNLVQQIQGNLSAPMTADAGGAATKSAKKSHTMKANQNTSEEQQEIADSEKRKLSRMS